MPDMDHWSGTIANATTSIVSDTPNATGAYVLLYGAAHAGITVNFEGTVDGGGTWIPLAAYRVDSSAAPYTVNSVALVTNSSNQFYILVGAAEQIRVRSSAYTSGTLVVNTMVVKDADPVMISSGTANYSTPATLADGTANPTAGGAANYDYLFNNSTWDRNRNNENNILVDSSNARTSSGVGTTGINFNHRGIFVYYNITAVSGTTPTIVFRLQWSPDGSTFVDFDVTNAATASITATGTYVLKIYPGLTTAANASLNSPVPRQWRSAWTIGGTTPSFTFSSLVSYIL